MVGKLSLGMRMGMRMLGKPSRGMAMAMGMLGKPSPGMGMGMVGNPSLGMAMGTGVVQACHPPRAGPDPWRGAPRPGHRPVLQRWGQALVSCPAGLTQPLCSPCSGGVSGACMNPARAFGPALVANYWDYHWVYWVGPMVAALLVSVLVRYVVPAAARGAQRCRLTPPFRTLPPPGSFPAPWVGAAAAAWPERGPRAGDSFVSSSP